MREGRPASDDLTDLSVEAGTVRPVGHAERGIAETALIDRGSRSDCAVEEYRLTLSTVL